jgi:hypothetical protein
MNYKRKIAGLFIAGIAAALLSFSVADDDPLSKIIALLDKWTSVNPQEKVYLQLDKPYYAIGDDIWFKAYITVGSQHKLSALSGVLNVELINDKDSVKQSLKLPVISGLTWGDFALSDSLKEGNYRIRAYTNWMRNAGSEYFFDKAITITNSITNSVFTHTIYSYSTQKGQQKVSAVIGYTDLNGAPYANKQVNYKIELGDKAITKGGGQTDDKGNLNLSFINPTPQALKSGRIVTDIKLADKKPVEKSVLIKAASSNTDMQFFPEGGNLVNGSATKMAFKAVGADGLGADIKGVIMDNNNNQVGGFGSSHLGMGVFTLKPENGKTYKAKITYADGSESVIELPKSTNGGYSLSIDNNDTDVVHVKILPGSVISKSSSADEVMSLVAQAGGQVYYAGKSKPGSKFFTADIPKSKFPSGIVQFTLFSSAGEPVNERLVFIQNHDQLKLSAVTGAQAYSPRQKVKIDLNALDKDNKPVIGSFSVAVTDETNVPVDENDENSILSNLLLTSDIKGYIEQPNYYFNHENGTTQADLDILMLTQGYHRFEWKQVLDDNYPAIAYGPEKALQISGHLKTLLGRPVVNGKVTLFTSKGGLFMIDTVSDSRGNFTFKNLIFRDSVRFVIQARTAKDRKNIEIDIDNVQPVPAFENKNEPDFLVNLNNGLSPFLQSSKTQYDNEVKYGILNRSVMLKEVVIKDKREEPLINSSNLNGPGNADQVIKASDNILSDCGDIATCLQGRIAGVVFRNDTPYLMSNSHRPMQIILDGSYVDGVVLTSINPNEIESVEVLKSIEYTSIYGGRGGSGILIITSKAGRSGLDYQRYSPGVINYMPKGYAKVREFYAPKYDNPKTNTQMPDLRSTIFWKPNIVTDKDGKALLEYFNADAKGIYRVVIEGIDDNGSLGRLVLHYEVE